MVFTLEEIKNYLGTQKSIDEAVLNLSESNIVNCITDATSFNFEKTTENLSKYEMKIGLGKLKEEQQTIYRNSNGTRGKYWMALSPKWIDSDKLKEQLKTEFDIAYWVNYGDDDVYGWFSVEQIRQWLSTPDLKLKTLGGSGGR
jgi:hypothetical protein